MKVLVSGATGMVGSALCRFLKNAGHDVVRLVRRKPANENDVRWQPSKGYIDKAALEAHQLDAVVHLAGENIVGLWTGDKKEKIKKSRVQGTQLLADTIASLEHKPSTFVSASAIGYYGNRGDEVMSETSPPSCSFELQPRDNPFFLFDKNWGARFLSETCLMWEDACQPARDAGIRTVNVRIGIVLSKRGGALAAALPAFKLGVAGPFGSGQQYMSWIAIDDLVGVIHHALVTPDLKGPVNAVAPNPVKNKEFTRTLSEEAFIVPFLGSMANFIPAPAPALKLATGEMGNALFLSSTRVEPTRLKETGYRFVYPELEGAIKHVLS